MPGSLALRQLQEPSLSRDRGRLQQHVTERRAINHREVLALRRERRRLMKHHKWSRDKVRAHRERLRKQGLRPIQIWVPDTRSRPFKAQAHRQSLAVADSEFESDDQAFIDAVSDLGSE